METPAEMNEELKKVQKKLLSTGADLNLVDPEKTHLTLKFLGEIDEERVSKVKRNLERAVKDIDPSKTEFKDLGVFPSRDYITVVWVGATGEIFHKLHQAVEREMQKIGFEKEEKDFVPHATIARVKSGKAKKEILDLVKSYSGKVFGETTVEKVKLKKSNLTPEGPIYSDISVVAL